MAECYPDSPSIKLHYGEGSRAKQRTPVQGIRITTIGPEYSSVPRPGGLGFHVVAVRLTSTPFTLFLPTGVSSAPGLAKLVGGCNPRPGCSVVRSTPVATSLEGLQLPSSNQVFTLSGHFTTGGGRTSSTETGAPRLRVVKYLKYRKALLKWSLVAGEAQKAVGTQPLSATLRCPA